MYVSISMILVSLFLGNYNLVEAKNAVSAEGAISSLVFGMPPTTSTVNMNTVQKFVLSGDWRLITENGKVTNFTSNFYTGPVNGANNHTHQLSNLRVPSDSLIQVSPDRSTRIIGILNVGTNGKNAWNDVHTVITISNERTITIKLADNDTQNHFMNQPIYGIVKHIKTD